MKLLKTIKDEDVFGEADEYPIIKERKAARAVVLNEENKVGMLYVSKYDYYKIPGGGVEDNEDIKEALDRECLEEIGRCITIVEEIGIIREYREQFNLKQDSYCYLAKTTGSQMKPDFTDEELLGVFQTVWFTLDEAIEKIKNCKPKNYEGAFIKMRDICFLEEAKKILNKK